MLRAALGVPVLEYGVGSYYLCIDGSNTKMLNAVVANIFKYLFIMNEIFILAFWLL